MIKLVVVAQPNTRAARILLSVIVVLSSALLVTDTPALGAEGIPLAWVDHDFFFPDAGETDYWKVHCGCDVESWTQRDSGHALVAHRSMPTFTAEVVRWLAAKGLGPEVEV